MKELQYTTNEGDFLVIYITGVVQVYIAQVTQSKPLRMKVQEFGPYANLKPGDFIIKRIATEQLQRDVYEETCEYLKSMRDAGVKVVSGLESLGVTDGKMCEMLPAE